MAKTVADQFAEILAAAGVKRIYGIVGDSLNGITDSIRRPARLVRAFRFINALPAVRKILFQLGLMPQIISDYLIDVGKGDGSILLRDLFGPRGQTLPEARGAYLAETLTAIIAGHPQSEIGDLMPWRFRKTSSQDQ